MKPWHQVVVPHRDIREGKFDESVFKGINFKR